MKRSNSSGLFSKPNKTVFIFLFTLPLPIFVQRRFSPPRLKLVEPISNRMSKLQNKLVDQSALRVMTSEQLNIKWSSIGKQGRVAKRLWAQSDDSDLRIALR
jgi:hypothetical protein